MKYGISEQKRINTVGTKCTFPSLFRSVSIDSPLLRMLVHTESRTSLLEREYTTLQEQFDKLKSAHDTAVTQHQNLAGQLTDLTTKYTNLLNDKTNLQVEYDTLRGQQATIITQRKEALLNLSRMEKCYNTTLDKV